MDYNFSGIIRDNSFDTIPMKETIHRPEPIPFKYDGLDYMREGVGAEFNMTLEPLVRPFRNMGYNTAAAYNRSLGVFFEHLDCMADFIAEKTGTKKGDEDLFNKAANIYNNNTIYYQNQAQKHGSTFLNELLGEAIGGAPVGITEFMMNVPYAGFLGAAEAHKKGKSATVGALTEGAKRGILGAIFHVISPLKQYLRAPTMGSVFGIQATGEGAEPRDVAKSFGTGFLYSMASPGGAMGLNEIRQNLRVQTNLKPAGINTVTEKQAANEFAKLKADPVAEAAHKARNNIVKIASKLRKIKKTDPTGYKKGMVELGKLEKAFDKSQEFAIFMESHNKIFSPNFMKKETIAYSKEGVVKLIRNRRRDLNLANYKTNKFANKLEKTLSKTEREAIPFIIEKTGVSSKLGRLDLEDIVSGLREPKTKKTILEHWSSKKDLTEIDPAKYGTGIKGAEDKRRQTDPDTWVNRSYYGVKGRGYKPEPGLGSTKYEVRILAKDLYDLIKDPLNLRKDSVNLYEKAIKEAGFKGYRVDSPTKGSVVALFEKTKVTESLEQVAQKVKEHFDEGWAKIVEAAPEMSAREVENYVTHIWDIPKARKQEVTGWFITNNRFLKKRYIENLNAGIEMGLQPKTLDIVDIIRIHDSVTNRVIENNKLVADLLKLEQDGTPLILRMDKAPQDWILYDHPALRKPLAIKKDIGIKEKISTELETVLKEIGLSIGRQISSKSKAEGWYKSAKEEMSVQEKASARVVAHEVGHFLDHKLGLTQNKFLDQFKDELYTINQKRIERFKDTREERYAKSSEEQIAEFFAELFTKPKKTMEVAPTATQFIFDVMAQDGKLSRLVNFDFEKNAKEIIKEQILRISQIPVKVHPDLKKPLDVIFQPQFHHDAIQGYEALNGVLKKTQLSLSLFHHLALSETSIAMTGIKKTADIALNPVKLYKALAKNEFDVFEKFDLAQDFIKHNGQVGATIDIPIALIQAKLDNFARKTEDIPLINRTTEFIASFNKQWDKALWNYLHDSLKIYAYESLVAKHVEGKSGDITKRKQEIAQLVNDTFGGQNWEVMMKNPRTLQLARWMLLSPDWTYSTMRQALAPTGVGAIYKETKGLRQKVGAMFWIKAALYYGMGINIINGTFRAYDERQHPEFYPESAGPFMWNNTIGHKTHLFMGRYEDGSERYLRWGKQFRELPELLWDSTGGFSPVSATLKKLGGKAAPALQVGTQIFTGHSLSGFQNREIAREQGWHRVAGIAKVLLKSPLPFSSRNLMNEGKEFHLTDMAMPSSKGIGRYKAIEYFKTAIYKKDELMLRELYQDVLRNNLPAHTLFHTALIMVKAESTREYNKGLATIEDVNTRLKIETNPEAIKRLTKLRKRMTKENTDRSLGLLLIDKSIMELNKHDSNSQIN